MRKPVLLFALFVPLILIAAGCSLIGGGRTQVYATGEASWYGPGYEGRLTASGERFNSSAMTAAHQNLPFGTQVRVTNMENGRSVVVRINDRFPGTRGRVIDLSRASFAKIAPLERGVVPVRLEVLN